LIRVNFNNKHITRKDLEPFRLEEILVSVSLINHQVKGQCLQLVGLKALLVLHQKSNQKLFISDIKLKK
jgi:hypothetical protein